MVQQRVDALLRLLIAGAQHHDLCQYASAPEQNWQVSERQTASAPINLSPHGPCTVGALRPVAGHSAI